ncbi:hypothetical protein FSP39_011623 [Pinctada imbricata]|uniref:Uncharacterized protein n=1 Tax=Pinctada imbricata TaxID=66713 RepID=A0AA88XRK2_PINIB|nr:hypothetical protein FSP39_011623 [Pinctada imbricata]
MKNGVLSRLVRESVSIAQVQLNQNPADDTWEDVEDKDKISKVFNGSRASSVMKNVLISPRTPTFDDYSDSDEDLSLSSDDETNGRDEVNQRKYWDEFDNSIKLIDDNTQYFALKPKPNFKSSDDFKGVMTDMFGNTEYGSTRGYTKLKEKINKLSNVSGLASRMLARAAATVENDINDNDDETDDIDEEKEKADLKSELIGAKRSWKLIKRHVQETTMEKNTEKMKLNWDMVTHHVKGVTDLDKARDDLYKRYGVVPTTQKDGKFECRNIMWSERAIRLNMTNPGQYNVFSHEKSKRRVQSAHPRRPKTAARTLSLPVNRPFSDTRINLDNTNMRKTSSVGTPNVNTKNLQSRPSTSHHVKARPNQGMYNSSNSPTSEKSVPKRFKDLNVNS